MMLRFRPPTDRSSPLPTDPRALIADVFRPAHWFAGPGMDLEWQHLPREDIPWEVFRGRLLDPAHTRIRHTFEAWNLYQVTEEGRSAEPLLSVKLDTPGRKIHVVRGLDSYVWEGYEDQPGVYLSRERRKWVRELVGSVTLDHFEDPEELHDELISLLFHAVVGTSRLPLSSVEAPLPSFSFGELFYCHQPGTTRPDPLRSWADLPGMLSLGLAWREKAKLLETFLHAVPPKEIGDATATFVERWQEVGHSPQEIAALLRTLFNEVSLSPYTDLVDKTLAFVDALEGRGTWAPGEGMDFLGHVLRQLGRHLSAFDLITFHHRGANYPDALLLDAVLAAYLARIERHPDRFLPAEGDAASTQKEKRLRRRALRQGWLIRRQYEGHPVPDAPTSPGENNRVLPPTYPRVSEEQILQAKNRRRRLFETDLAVSLGSKGSEVLHQSVADLADLGEGRELGLALFLDRPLGSGKQRAEPDATPLLACEAFSPSLARRRLQVLATEFGPPDAAIPDVPGVPAAEVGGVQRPGVVSLRDALQAGPDFVFLRSAALGIQTFLSLFDLTPLQTEGFDTHFLSGRQRVLIVPSGEASLRIHDSQFRPRLEVRPDLTAGYGQRAGLEFPARGLLVERLWDGEGNEIPPRAILRLRPRARPWCDVEG